MELFKSRTTSTASSPQVTTTAAAAADLDPLREPQQPAQEAVPVPAVPSTAHEDAISATQDHTSFLDGMQSHESNRCPWNSFQHQHQIYILHVLVWRSALERFEFLHLTWLPRAWIAGSFFEGSSTASCGKELQGEGLDWGAFTTPKHRDSVASLQILINLDLSRHS